MRIFYLFLLALALVGCRENKKAASQDFEDLMGKNQPCWQYIQTTEDRENLTFFKTLFEKNLQTISSNELKVPKVIHFIWLGPRNFPLESIENVKAWVAKHPDWTFKFWTDRKRALPHPIFQEKLVEPSLFTRLGECYNKSENWAEKSDLLRYEILLREGGVYVDHDVKCMRSFDELGSSYDLYCGLELPSQTPLSSSVHVTNNLIACRPGHPIIKQSIDWVADNWDRIESLYPGKDRDAVVLRVGNRSFSAFAHAVRQLANQDGRRDMVFPAFYFNAPKDEQALFARHLYAGTWFENESAFEKNTRQRLMGLSKKVNKILLFVGVLTGLNCIGFAFLVIRMRKQPVAKKRRP